MRRMLLLIAAAWSCGKNVTATVDAGGDASSQVDAGGVTVADQYVSTSGDDSWDGTSPTFASGNVGPVATVARAQANIRPLLGTKPLTVAILGGTYYATELAFTTADNGTATAPVTYVNYADQTPMLSAGTRITGWTKSTTALCAGQTAPCFSTVLPAGTSYFEALYYNGMRRLRPRLGSSATNLGTYYRISATSATYDRFDFTPGDPIAALGNLTVANPGTLSTGGAAPAHDVTLYDFEDWDVDIQRIASVGATTVIMTGNTTPNSSHGYMQGHRYLVENVRAEFHAAGQWFLDRSGASWVLYYLANAGEDPTTDVVEIPQHAQVVTAIDLEFTEFRGLAFEADNFVIPETGFAATQLEPTVPAMVSCVGCQNVTFHNDVFAHSTGVGIELVSNGARPAQDDSVEYSEIYDTGSHGIRVGTMPRPADTDARVAQRIRVIENAITGAGRIVGGSDLVNFGDVHDCELGHNDGHDSYHGGLELCMPAGNKCQGAAPATSHGAFNNAIHDNDFGNIMQGVTDDGGCYYAMTSLATGTAAGNTMTHNSCHDVTDATGNGDPDGYGGECFYLDNGTGGWTVHDNLAYRCSGTLYNMTYGPQQDGTPNIYTNNIAAWGRSSAIGPSKCPPVTPDLQFEFAGNIVLMDRGEVQKGGTAHYLGTGGANALLYQAFANNTYCVKSGNSCTSPAFVSEATLCDLTTTPHPNLAAWQTFGEDSGSQVKDPGFTNPTYPADDFSAPATPGVSPTFLGGGAGITLSFGRTTKRPTPAVTQTFPIHPYDPATGF